VAKRRADRPAVFAIVSDIHGNRWALEEVLADARRHGATHLLNLGDVVYGPLDPAGTAELLLGLDWPALTVRGNQDRILFEPGADERLHPSLAHTRSRSTPEAIAWLSALPPLAREGDVLLIHGTPACDETYLLEDATSAGVRLKAAAEVGALLGEEEATLVLCGHSHLPGSAQIPGGPLVVNPGSVGLPAYAEDQPVVHRMETGSPMARYALAEKAGESWRVAWVAVPYDWEAAAAAALHNGRPDWAHALRTGRAD
jgi:predicted phosphodiesterase